MTGTPPADTEPVYRAARRHSRYVRVLRVALIAGIASLLLGVAIEMYMPPLQGFRLPGELGSLVIKGTKITMAQPRLTGFTSDSRPYHFAADSASQDIAKPDVLELHQIEAKMAMEDQSDVTMTADRGVYDTKNDKLTLYDNIVLISSTGYEGRLSQAVIDTKSGDVSSDNPVDIKLLDGTLKSKRLEMADHGDVVRFLGGVSMVLQQSKGGLDADQQ